MKAEQESCFFTEEEAKEILILLKKGQKCVPIKSYEDAIDWRSRFDNMIDSIEEGCNLE